MKKVYKTLNSINHNIYNMNYSGIFYKTCVIEDYIIILKLSYKNVFLKKSLDNTFNRI
jgi:hypothetical protein